jgi:branched-chain amino acid transport system ATP-binding protein
MAMAVIQRPTLLLLDEPTAGMSPTESAETIELVQTLAKERGLTVLFTEHDMSVVFSMSETVRVMHKGKLIAEGSGEEIKTNELVRKVYLGEVE